MTRIVQEGTAGITRKRVDLGYNEAGQYETIIRSTGLAGSETEVLSSGYSYFAGGGLDEISYSTSGAALPSGTGLPSLPAGAALSSYSYTYDAIGRVATFTAPEGTFTYGYDSAHQLTSADFAVDATWGGAAVPGATPPSNEDYSYDATGNEQEPGQVVVGNRPATIDGQDYQYTADGSVYRITDPTDGSYRLFVWDTRQRLAVVSDYDGGGSLQQRVAYTCDAFDRLVMRQVDETGDGTFDVTERNVWDGDQVALVLDEDGNVRHRFLHGPDVDQVFADESSTDGLLWYLTDAQHTVRDVARTTAGVTEIKNHLIYSAFGEILSETDPSSGFTDASALTPHFA